MELFPCLEVEVVDVSQVEESPELPVLFLDLEVSNRPLTPRPPP